jgi:tetratricopeptide (TPR) repeat protein
MADDKQPEIVEGPGKGKPFFDRAQTVAESGNHDYAIDMFIEGLKREPAEQPYHEALWKTGFQRKLKGGKPDKGSIFGGPKLPMKGKSPKDQLLNSAWQLAKDMGNMTHMLSYLRAATALNYPAIIQWLAPIIRTANRGAAKPKKEIYVELADSYVAIKDFANAADCIADAMKLAPMDMALNTQLKDISAQHTMQKANYDKVQQGEAVPTFKESLKDAEKTKELLQEDALSQSLEYRGREVEKARLEYEAAPRDHRMIAKYAMALRSMEDEEYDNQAIDMLTKAYGESGTYQYKKTVDEIRIKHLQRKAQKLKDQVRAKPDDAEAKDKFKQLQAEQLKYELEAYKDWSEHYPTDMGIMFAYGERLYLNRQYDDAIHAFQQSQNNPNKKIFSLYYLGMSFDHQKMLTEALETFRTAVAEYDMIESGNDLSKRIYYQLARVYEKSNMLKEAADIYSKITRWEFNYLDARVRLAEVRKKLEGK